MAFPAQIDLADLDGNNGFTINEVNEGDGSGSAVSSLGDINGDGIDDIITIAGDAGYIIFGTKNGFDRSLNLSDLDSSSGTTVIGIKSATFRSPPFASSAGDFNGDGFNDIIFGVKEENSGFSVFKKSYLVFGTGNGFGDLLNLQDLNGSNGFVINGGEGDISSSGTIVGSAGDINDDGFDDVIVSKESESSYVLFGSADEFSRTVDLSDFDGSNGFSIDVESRLVSSAGDVNGDGIDDIIIGNPDAAPNGKVDAGTSYVVFGRRDFSGAPDLENLDENFDENFDENSGFFINGSNEFEDTGSSVSDAGDINGDGFDDVMVTSFPSRENTEPATGEIAVVFGSATSENIELQDLDGSNGFILTGTDSFDYAGSELSRAGDVNSDGIDDIIIGAPGSDPKGEASAGVAYVVFGRSDGFDRVVDLPSLDGSNGFVINGKQSGSFAGSSVSDAGDVNDDGISDVIIGAPTQLFFGGDSPSETYVVFGADGSAPPTSDNATPTANNDALFVDENTILFGSVFDDNGSGVDFDPDGDIFTVIAVNGKAEAVGNAITLSPRASLTLNADGTFSYDFQEELFPGTRTFDSFSYTIEDSEGGSDNGLVNLTIRGSDEPDEPRDKPLNLVGTREADRLRGGNNKDTLRGRRGNDTLLGRDGGDSLGGSSGDDVLKGGDGNDILNGGGGNDVLYGIAGRNTLNGGNGNDKIRSGLGNSTLNGGNGNDILRSFPGSHILNGGNGNDILDTAPGNSILNGGNGNDILKATAPGNNTLDGGDGNDTLRSGIGKDILIGGGGNDRLRGGSNGDVFVLAPNSGTDVIVDFFDRQDRIGLSGGLSFADLTFSGRDILITNTQERLATLIGIQTADLGSNRFIAF
ncbi:MAG: hypothetical protein AAFR25_10205 [Cyanobacteria bacterium J06629_19]